MIGPASVIILLMLLLLRDGVEVQVVKGWEHWLYFVLVACCSSSSSSILLDSLMKLIMLDLLLYLVIRIIQKRIFLPPSIFLPRQLSVGDDLLWLSRAPHESC